MTTFQKFFLRLCVAQGVCLAIGFGVVHQLKMPNSIGVESAEISSSEYLRATSVAFLGTWGLMAAFTGLIIAREQRQQFEELFARYDEPEYPCLQLYGADEHGTEFIHHRVGPDRELRPQLSLRTGTTDSDCEVRMQDEPAVKLTLVH
ncbi:hypothetical protein SH668x_002072 [Planctomicrobium sp. SH668]|uniref:hypothetical protein n=1 Tax=Planctomicrobium sp. SH668 TaxID=3448126 RepID=UPI003F5BF167